MPDERQPLPDPHEPGWREAGQARTDFASIESDLDDFDPEPSSRLRRWPIGLDADQIFSG
jgi:hypothetical protein